MALTNYTGGTPGALTNLAGGGGGTTPTLTGTPAGEALPDGAVVIFADDAGTPKVFLADANGAPALRDVVGVNIGAASPGDEAGIVSTGAAPIPDGQWDAVPSPADVGKRVYLSNTPGGMTLTPPAYALRIGWLIAGGSGNCVIDVDIGEGVGP